MQDIPRRRKKAVRKYDMADSSGPSAEGSSSLAPHSAAPLRLARAGAGGKPAPAAATKEEPQPGRRLRFFLLAGTALLLLMLCLLAAALLPGCRQTSSSAPSGISSRAASVSASYDKDALSIPVSQYAGTILETTGEAGEDYVEETLFLGDSNTAGMLLFGNVTGVGMENGIGIESMGITSVTTLRCVRFSGLSDMTMPKAVAVMQPRRVVITFGTNNAGMSTENFIASYKAALDAIAEAYPSADILIGSVFPITKACKYGSLSQKNLDEFNLALVEFARGEGYKFLNWAEALKDPQSGYCKPEYMQGDGVHLNEKGHTAIFEYFNTHAYITEDIRPKPLNAIPRRLPTPEGLFPKPQSAAPAVSTPVPVSVSSVPQPATYTLSVWVTDTAGGAGIASGNTTLQAVEGQAFSVPVSAHLSVTAADGTVYNFTGWSNGDGNASTTISFTAPPASAPVYTITANYAIQAPPTPPSAPPSEPDLAASPSSTQIQPPAGGEASPETGTLPTADATSPSSQTSTPPAA